MFKYMFKSDIKVLTPFCQNLSDIKKDITQTAEYIRNISTYPNGLVLDMLQYSDRLEVTSNKELHDNGDGTISVVL